MAKKGPLVSKLIFFQGLIQVFSSFVNCLKGVSNFEIVFPLKMNILQNYKTDFQFPHLNHGQKLKSKRIACKFVLFKAFAKPSVKSSDVKQDLYVALEKRKKI